MKTCFIVFFKCYHVKFSIEYMITFSIKLGLRQFFFEVNRVHKYEEFLQKPCASHHASTHISQKSCFSLKTKNIHWPTFVSSFSAFYRVSIPAGYPRRSVLLFQASRHGQFLHIAFARDVDIDSGTLVNREPQTR